MKKTVVLLAGIATLSVGTYMLSNRLWAQTAPAPAARPQLRVGMVNMSHVVKSYKKFINFNNEFKKLFEGYNAEVTKKEGDLAKLQNDLRDPAKANMKEKIELDIKNMARAIQDLKDEANKKFGQRGSDSLVAVYRDVEQATALIAQKYGYDLVLHYNDAVEPAELYSAGNVQRKLTTAGCLPLYMPGLDISAQVIETLNWNWDNAQAKAGGAPVK